MRWNEWKKKRNYAAADAAEAANAEAVFPFLFPGFSLF